MVALGKAKGNVELINATLHHVIMHDIIARGLEARWERLFPRCIPDRRAIDRRTLSR